jgi:hypothetical protein
LTQGVSQENKEIPEDSKEKLKKAARAKAIKIAKEKVEQKKALKEK